MLHWKDERRARWWGMVCGGGPAAAVAVLLVWMLVPPLAFGERLPADPDAARGAWAPADTAGVLGASVAAEAGQASDAGLLADAESGDNADEPALPTVSEVMNHVDRLYRADSSRARMRMEIVTRRWERTLEMEAWTRGTELALTVIRSPAREAGTATLRNAEGLWNYAPRADRLMRIPSGMMSDGWMGSHFTNDDMMRESSWEDDYETELSWDEEDGQRVLRAVSVPKPDAPVVWSRVVTVMRADDWVPLRGEYWDGDTKRRTMQFSDIRDVQGRPIPMRMELIPHDEPGERTVVIYERLELDVDVDDALFTQRGLRREAQRR